MDCTLPTTSEHKSVARLVFAERLSTAAQREKVWLMLIFSNEKEFNLDGPDGYKHHWRDLRRPPRRYVTRQNGGGTLMVWGAIGSKGNSGLVVLEECQNSGHYIYTVSKRIVPFTHINYGTDFVFMQDNASIYSSNESRKFFKEIAVQLLDRPARSPDLNQSENVWAIMTRKIYNDGKQFSPVSELRSAVMEAWASITMKELEDLMDSMPSRCVEVARNNDLSKQNFLMWFSTDVQHMQ